MNVRTIKPTGTVLIAAVALVIGLEAPAAAHQIAHQISGSTIKEHSIAGNRLKNNTITGVQVKESTLGVVPRATTASKLTPLKWHPLSLDGTWVSFNAIFGNPRYAVDAQGFVHLEGAISDGVSGSVAFTLPVGARPAFIQQLTADENLATTGRILITTNGDVTPADDYDHTGSSTAFLSLDGIEFPTS